jgi:hypothetical protein
MLYNLADDLQRQAFLTKVDRYLSKGAVVDLSGRAFRTKAQNAYLHAILGVVAMDTGVTLQYCKDAYFKRLVNPDLFVRETDDKYAGRVTTLRSSADLTKEEMSVAIDRFKRWASGEGIYIPEMGDDELLKQVYIDMGRMSAYIGG